VIIDATLLLDWAREQLGTAFIVFLRIGAMLALVPAFGEQSIPVRVRLALALAFTLVVLPAVSGTLPLPDGISPGLIGYLLAEVTTGLLFGIMLRLFVLALLMAGTIIAQSTSLAQLFGGNASAEPSPAVGHLLVSAGLALATLLGLHVQVAAYMIGSYALVPAGIWPLPDTVMTAGVSEIARSLQLAFSLSMPFVIGALLYNLCLGFINRAMPQLMVTFVGAPALTAGSLVLLLLALPMILSLWSDSLFGFLGAPFGRLP
jgi:flagellar biosynthesis protein FliR